MVVHVCVACEPSCTEQVCSMFTAAHDRLVFVFPLLPVDGQDDHLQDVATPSEALHAGDNNS